MKKIILMFVLVFAVSAEAGLSANKSLKFSHKIDQSLKGDSFIKTLTYGTGGVVKETIEPSNQAKFRSCGNVAGGQCCGDTKDNATDAAASFRSKCCTAKVWACGCKGSQPVEDDLKTRASF